jgi:hypothetical protein
MKLSKALPRQPVKVTSRRAGFTAGWRSLVGRWRMQAVYVCAGLGNVAWSVGISIGMALAVVKYDIQGFGVQGFAAYGLIMGAYGVGSLISIFVVGNLQIRRLYHGFTFGSVVNGLGIAAIGAAVLYLPPEQVLAGMMVGAGLAALGGPLIDISFILLIQTRFKQSEIAGLARLRFAALGASILIAGACGAALYAHFETGVVIVGAGIFEVIVGAIVLLVPQDNDAVQANAGQTRADRQRARNQLRCVGRTRLYGCTAVSCHGDEGRRPGRTSCANIHRNHSLCAGRPESRVCVGVDALRHCRRKTDPST